MYFGDYFRWRDDFSCCNDFIFCNIELLNGRRSNLPSDLISIRIFLSKVPPMSEVKGKAGANHRRERQSVPTKIPRLFLHKKRGFSGNGLKIIDFCLYDCYNT